MTAPLMLHLTVSNLKDVGIGYDAPPKWRLTMPNLEHSGAAERAVIIYCIAPLMLLLSRSIVDRPDT